MLQGLWKLVYLIYSIIVIITYIYKDLLLINSFLMDMEKHGSFALNYHLQKKNLWQVRNKKFNHLIIILIFSSCVDSLHNYDLS